MENIIVLYTLFSLKIVSLVAVIVGLYFAFVCHFYNQDKTQKEIIFSGFMFSILFALASLCSFLMSLLIYQTFTIDLIISIAIMILMGSQAKRLHCEYKKLIK